MKAITQLKLAASEAINAAHRGQHAEAVESLCLALAKLEQQEIIERQLEDVGFRSPSKQAAFKQDPRGAEYGGYTAYPQSDGSVNIEWEGGGEGDMAWECKFPCFDNFDTWARAHS